MAVRGVDVGGTFTDAAPTGLVEGGVLSVTDRRFTLGRAVAESFLQSRDVVQEADITGYAILGRRSHVYSECKAAIFSGCGLTA